MPVRERFRALGKGGRANAKRTFSLRRRQPPPTQLVIQTRSWDPCHLVDYWLNNIPCMKMFKIVTGEQAMDIPSLCLAFPTCLEAEQMLRQNKCSITRKKRTDKKNCSGRHGE